MERLWAPWRMGYIKEVDRHAEQCVFCRIAAEQRDRENLILYRGEQCFVVMNRYPYTNAHILVVPYAHIATLEKITDHAHQEMWTLIRNSVSIIEKAYTPHGFNVGMNIGRAGGAGIHTHLHMHAVPRWSADTNFITALADTRVVSEGILETYDTLKPGFDQLRGSI